MLNFFCDFSQNPPRHDRLPPKNGNDLNLTWQASASDILAHFALTPKTAKLQKSP